MNKTLLAVFPVILLLYSCTKYAFYQSPLHNNTHMYKEQPMHGDSSSSAIYASGTYSVTGANKLRDAYNAFHGSIHRAHSFSRFSAYYGLTGGVGNYRVKPVDQGERPSPASFINFYNEALNDSLITANSGTKSFSYYGINGGINYVKPWPYGEWRVLGVGFSYTNEFGKYLDFRQKLPDSAVNMVDREPRTFTVAISTDFIAKTGGGNAGYQLAWVFNTRKIEGLTVGATRKTYQSAYITHTLHITQNKTTGYFQVGTGFYTFGMQLGANYRLGK